MTVITESNNLRDIIRHELDDPGRFSRKVVTMAAGQAVSMGQVLGKVLFSTPIVGTAAAGNTGGGVVSAVVAKAKTMVGTYTVICTAYTASPLAATFAVYDPDGDRMADFVLGANANNQIGLTITDGSPVITVGDEWTIAVAVGSGECQILTMGNVDGTQKAYGIAIADYDNALADVEGVAVERDAIIVSDNLIWPDTSPAMTEAQKTQALIELAEVGIIARDEA